MDFMTTFDLPGYPKPVDLAPRLRTRTPFTAGLNHPVMTGAFGTDYPRVETEHSRQARDATGRPDDLHRRTDAAYARMLSAAPLPGPYTIRSFDTLMAWYSAERDQWYVTTMNIGRSHNYKRVQVKLALGRIGAPYILVTGDRLTKWGID